MFLKTIVYTGTARRVSEIFLLYQICLVKGKVDAAKGTSKAEMVLR